MDITKLSIYEQKELVKNPNTSDDTLKKLLDPDVNEMIRYFLAENPNTSGDVLREAAKDISSVVRQGVGANLNTPKDILRELAKDENILVRAATAENPHTPEDVLHYLATDKTDDWTRLGVAKNTSSSSKLLLLVFNYEKSLKEPEENVIKALYKNPKLPYIAKVIIETLYGDWL